MRCPRPGSSAGATGGRVTSARPGVGVAAPAGGVAGNVAVGEGVASGGGSVGGAVGAVVVVGAGEIVGGDGVAEVGALVTAVGRGTGKAGIAVVGVGDGGADVGATMTMAVVAVSGAEIWSPHAATISRPVVAVAITRARVRTHGMASWEMESSGGPMVHLTVPSACDWSVHLEKRTPRAFCD